ncbi:MAG: hypothetical protein NC489_29535 [Ruminococcus flavefaciens]|nr:hypothetical protein [Ruminococcus flavefaciens]
MGFTQIIKRNGTVIKLNTKEPFCIVKEATQNSSLMGDDYITLKIVSTEWLSFDKGDKIVVDGMDYTIRATTKRDTEAENYYVFEPVFYGPMYDLMKTIYRNTDKDGKSDRSTFDLTYTIKEFVQVLIYNLNRDYPGLWAFDEDNCPETEAKTIQFSGVNCLQALQSLCSDDNFKLEFLITQNNGVRTIHIGKFGQRINPPGGKEYFEWGKGNGLYKLSEQKIDDKAIITRLWVEGGTNNIRTDYRDYSERLQLPFPKRYNRNRHVLYDGTVIEPNTEIIGIDDDSKRYLEDTALKDKLGSEEDTKTYDEIYPTRTGRVTALVADDINSFIDDTMDFDLNEKDGKSTKYLVDGVSAKITFTSGRLAGEQFELNAKGGYDHSKKQFKLIPFTDNRGLVTPTVPVEQGGAFPIEVGATYKITDIFLPESYEQNAEEDLWYAGYNDFKPATQARAQYNLTLDRLYFLEALNRDTEVCVFKVGDYVPVKDTRYGIEKYIRIQKIQRNLLLEQDYQLTLSDTTAISIQTQTVLSVIEHDQVITNNRLRDLTKMRRGWRTTEDLRNMVYDTDGFFDVDNIRPNSIDTNMLTVGSKSQQFVLTGVILQANVGGNPNIFAASDGVLSHLTIDPNGVRAWQMGGQSFTLQSTAGHYLFARCSKSGTTGTWYISQEQLSFEPTSDPNNYYFLVGVIGTLHSDDNFRDFTTTYGFTRINGNTITTGRIVTSDGECYLDLDGNKFRIGDASSSIDWNVSRNHAITLKNVSVVSESGDVSPLGVYRGVWNENYTYYTNDEVTYTENGATCTYRYIHPQPSKGHKPTESTYWAIVAKGADGKDGVTGDWVSYVFKQSDTKPTKPSGTKSIPDGWSDAPNSTGKWWMSKATINGATQQAGTWSDPVQVTAEDGVDGKYIDFKYCVKKEDETPDTPEAKRNPTGWSDEPPQVGEGEALWMSQAEIDADNKLVGTWSKPVRISGEKGEPGADGKDGDGNRLVYRYAFDKPTRPTGTDLTPTGWSDTPDREEIKVTHGSVWTLENGYYLSPTIEDNGITTNRITIVTTKPNQLLAIELWADSETSYDFVLVGKLDSVGLTRTSNYLERISGPNVKKVVYLPIPTAGTHFVDVAYAKDGSQSKNSDCGRYRIVVAPNCWLSIGTVNGETAKVVSWSDPVPFSIDTADVERIYRLMSTETTPETPDSDEYVDDYVPPLTTETHVVGKTYNKGDIVIGADGLYYESLDNSNTATPVAKSGSLWVISLRWHSVKGWTDNPSDVTAGYRYQYESVRKKKDGKWGAFSTPVLWMVLPQNGEDGKPGVNGDFTEYRYAVSGGKLAHGKTFNASLRTPGDDWKTEMPSVGVLQYLWLTTAKINGETNALIGSWSEPIRVNGIDGEPGQKGDSPALVYRGVYDKSATYYGTAQRVDCVKHIDNYYVACVGKGSFSNKLPTNTNYWNDFGAEFESIATGLLLAENANIANLIFRNERLESSSQSNGVPNFYLDGLNNIASFAAGNVVFDKNSAKIAWLRIVGSDLIGYDASGMERLKLTPNALPAATGHNSTELLTPLSCESQSTGEAEIGYDQSGTVAEGFWGSGDIFYTAGRDDRQDEYQLSYWCAVEMNVPNPNVTLFLSDGQFGISDVRDFNNKPTTKGPTLQSATASVSRVNSNGSLTSLGTVDLTGSNPQITIPTACRIRILFSIHVTNGSSLGIWTGKAYVSFQGFPVSTSATETIIAKDGMMAIYNGNYMRMHSGEGFSVKIGNYYFRITSSNGIQKSTNGSTWTTL